MKSVVFRISALAPAIGVALVVASGGSCARATGVESAATTTATNDAAPAASVAAVPTASAATASDHHYDVIGPSTKADPHAIRRAVEGLTAGSASAPAPSTSAPR